MFDRAGIAWVIAGALGVAACSFAPSPTQAVDAHGTGDAPVGDGSAPSPDAPATNSISVTRTVLAVGTTVDLTSEGTLDWAEWGATSPTDFDHKAGGDRIANWTEVGTGTVNGYGNGYVTLGNDGFTWSDGTPTASETSAQYSGVWIVGAPNGFSTTVTADQASHVLRLYVGGYHATGTFTASLSDDASITYTDTDGIGDASESWAGVYVVTFESATAGAKLTVSWVQHGLGNDVNWSAASLR